MSDYSLELIEKKIKNILINELNRASLLYRLHSRIKEPSSIREKVIRKDYKKGGKLMQDLIGFRITTYFFDDLHIVIELCEKLFDKLELIYDTPDPEVFKPVRKNMICHLPKESLTTLHELKFVNQDYDIVDDTFEIQFRTTLSEGWHEVDHNLRYKCKEDWSELIDESRMLNGIYASLETSDQTLKALFEDISYHHFKAKRWEAMLRSKLRLRFIQQPLSSQIIEILNDNIELSRQLFKLERSKIIESYIKSTLAFPMTYDSFFFFINFMFLRDSSVTNLTPPVLIDEFKHCCS
jgi:putative GTP pyrophosphokinase